MPDREAQIELLLKLVERICMHMERHVPTENETIQEIRTLIKELKR